MIELLVIEDSLSTDLGTVGVCVWFVLVFAILWCFGCVFHVFVLFLLLTLCFRCFIFDFHKMFFCVWICQSVSV